MFAAQKLHKRSMNGSQAILEMDFSDGQKKILKLLFFSSTAFGLAYQGIFFACSLCFVGKKSIVLSSGPRTDQQKISQMSYWPNLAGTWHLETYRVAISKYFQFKFFHWFFGWILSKKTIETELIGSGQSLHHGFKKSFRALTKRPVCPAQVDFGHEKKINIVTYFAHLAPQLSPIFQENHFFANQFGGGNERENHVRRRQGPLGKFGFQHNTVRLWRQTTFQPPRVRTPVSQQPWQGPIGKLARSRFRAAPRYLRNKPSNHWDYK